MDTIWLAIGASVFICLGFIQDAFFAARLLLFGVRTTAEIISIDTDYRSLFTGRSYTNWNTEYISFRYKTLSNQTYEAKNPASFKSDITWITPGKELEIIYCKTRPQDARINGFPLYWPIIVSGTTLLIAIMFLTTIY